MTAVAGTVQAEPPQPLGIDGRPQANIIPSAHGKQQKSRHRASVACASCRDRRTRCIVPAGEKECNQCKSSGYECVITYDDERRKPNSKAHIQSLTGRIAVLERLLKEKGEEPPPASIPADVPGGAPKDMSVVPGSSSAQTTENLRNDSMAIQESSPEFIEHDSEASDGRTPPGALSNQPKESMVKKLLSTRGHLSFDQLSGRLRYFGPTTNCHIYSELNPSEENDRQVLEQQRRTEKIIRTLPSETHDYLMELFWQLYNSVLHVVHQAAFEEDRDNGRTQFYSGFLHICILAMAYRFADKSRPDMIKIALPDRETTLHREAKYMLDCELERPGGIPSIQALLLLGDLECGVGRDNVGWLYAGMANRLCFDLGLHLDSRKSGLHQREIEIRRMTLWACVVYDKYWALFLGRPTSLKSADLEVYNLSVQFERLGACQPAGPAKSLETQIYEALIDLMELAGKITEITDPASKANETDHNAYLRMAALDRELGSWYSRLAKPLQWTPQNISTAPFSFFLLHQQYHVTLILLHRPFALYDDAKAATENEENSDSSETDSHFSALSRTVCTKHAVRVARIFWQHRQRFDTRQIFVTGLQHAGTAAIALVAALAFIKDRSSRAANMQYLECLAAALQDMTQTYQPAERMSTVLEAVMVELRADAPTSSKSSRKVIPARRESSNEYEEPQEHVPHKRRQTARPRSARTTSQNMGNNRTSPMSQHDSVGQTFSNGTQISPDMERPTSGTSADQTSSSLEGFVMVTPRTDVSNMNGLWPNLSSTEESSLDYPMSYSNHFSIPSQQSFRSAWMGAETPNISRPTTAADLSGDTRLPSLPRSISERMDEDTFGSGDLNSADFAPLMSGGTDWLSSRIASDLNGFPPLPATPKAPTPIRMFPLSSSAKSTSSAAKGFRSQSQGSTNDSGFARAETIGGLNDIWNEMLKASNGGG